MNTRSEDIAIATYNALADAYIRPEYYPHCDPADFLPANRQPRLEARVAALGADVLLLQEVDYATFERLDRRLRHDRFVGRWAHKGAGKPDGCATFVREPFRIATSMIFDLDEGDGASSVHVALATVLVRDRMILTVVNTHLKWFSPDAPPEKRTGLAQARHLLEVLARQPRTVVGGDFNAEPDSVILDEFRSAGYADAHPASTATFVMEDRPRKIDYLLHTLDLKASPLPADVLNPLSVLPSKTEPSDHLPLIAAFSPA